MPGPPMARLGDLHNCTMPPGFPSPILPPCSVTVIVEKRPAARLGADLTMTGPLPVPPTPPAPHPFVKGSTTVLVNGMPVLRIGDTCALGGAITLGAATVLTGG